MTRSPLWVIAVMLLCATWAFAESATQPIVTLPQVPAGPQMDGSLDDPVWAMAATLSDFVLVGGRDLPRYPTEVRMMFDAKNLYVGVRVYSKDGTALKQDALQRDGAVYQDDCVALLVDTENARKRCAELAVNSVNTRYDAYAGDVTANFTWSSEVKVLPDGWSVEMALPFRDGVTPRPGEQWGLDVVRNAPGEGEMSSWCSHQSKLVEVSALGTLIFGGVTLSARIDDLGKLWLGQNTALLSVADQQKQAGPPKPEKVKVNVRVTGRDKYGHYFGSVVSEMTPGQHQQFQIPYSVAQDGPGSVLFSVSDAAGHVTWRSSAYPIDTPRVMEPLEQTLQELTAAWVSWGRLSAPQQAQFKSQLDDLTDRWQYLDRRYQLRQELIRPQAMAMQLEAERQRTEARSLRAQIQATH